MKSGDFVTADHHFGHANILKYTKRPFANVEEMDAKLIEAWNNKVPKDARVFHIGDFAFAKPNRISELLSLLNGHIFLIRGNHDKNVDNLTWKKFAVIHNYYEMETPDKTKIVMCHYPLLTWNKAHYGAWMLHGHCHGSLKDTSSKRLDIGIDTTSDYAPYSYEEIFEKMKTKGFVKVDHHG